MSGQANKRQDQPESYSPKKPDILDRVKQIQRDTSYPSEFILPDKSTAITSETEHNCPGYVTFANEFSYFLNYSAQGYGFIHKDYGWRCDINYTLADIISGYAMRPSSLEVTADGLDRLYRTVGFTSRQSFCADSSAENYMSEADMKEAIKYALNTLGQPVIVSPIKDRFFGAVVVGYKESGDVLVTFGYPPYFVAPDNLQAQIIDKSDWYQPDTVLTIVGKRDEIPQITDIYREGLRQVRDYLSATTRGEDKHYYDEWENFLRLDILEMKAEVRRKRYVPGAQMFSKDISEELSDEKIMEVIYTVCDPTWCEMAERRYYIMHLMHQASIHFPEEKSAIDEITGHFGWFNSIMGSDYISEVGHDPVDAAVFANPEVRTRMADCVVRFREADAKGLELVEALTERMGI